MPTSCMDRAPRPVTTRMCCARSTSARCSPYPTRRRPRSPAWSRRDWATSLARQDELRMDVDPSPISAMAAAPPPANARVLMRVAGLTKRFGDETALDDVAFHVRAGEILGLIGPNGAGKTTLLEGIAGLLPVDAGCVDWCGTPLAPAHRRDAIFYMPDGIRPYGDQPVVRVLDFFAG